MYVGLTHLNKAPVWTIAIRAVPAFSVGHAAIAQADAAGATLDFRKLCVSTYACIGLILIGCLYIHGEQKKGYVHIFV